MDEYMHGTSANAAQKANVAALYNRVATTYDHVGPPVFAEFGQRLVEITGISTGAKVLDIAAGRGANLFPAAAQVGSMGQVVGIDLAESMVEETRGCQQSSST